ncbi:carbohydrate ABC transporter permease [Microlunatus soli]|nr:sugar ABC transporter permease [Microlunatus soli]
MIFALWMSFTNYDGISPTTRSVGWANYRRAFGDGQMWTSLLQTVILMVIVVPLTVCVGLALAVLLNARIRLRAVYRTVIYLPAVIPVVAGSLTFRLLFDHDAGAVNGILDLINVTPIQWLTGSRSLVVLLAFMLWGVGASMVISLAGLQAVPAELIEAAMVDGAGTWQRFMSITVPLISPFLLFQLVTGVIGAIQLFVPAVLLGTANANGVSVAVGIPEGLRVYMVYVYQTYFGLGEFGYASALLWLLFIVIVAFTAAVFGITRSFVFYGGGEG